MKTFKTYDLWINILLIISFAVVSGLKQDNTFIIGYIVVGGWQVISMLVHAYNKCLIYKTGSRYVYHWITFVSIVTMPVGSLWILLFFAPVMAVYYTWMCYYELNVKMQRPLAVLK